MHSLAYATPAADLSDFGLYRFRKGAELHSTSPEFVRRMHAHIRKSGPETYSAFEELSKSSGSIFLRDLLEMVPEQPVPLDEVEPLDSILKRFSTQAMSLGSLSPEAHKTLTLAMNQIGGRSNTGEGGEDPDLYATPGAASKVKQVASGRFGVTAEYLVRAEELEIKMAQGSKPGEGGQLPARKVTEYIARIRHATPGTPLISPPPHHDIYSIEDLAQLIHDLARRKSPSAHWREARFRHRHRRHRRRRCKSRRERDHHQRTQWRHRLFAAHFDQEHRPALGNRPARYPRNTFACGLAFPSSTTCRRRHALFRAIF